MARSKAAAASWTEGWSSTLISALLYWLGVPRIDFAVCFSVLWMISGMVLELISPQPLSPYMIIVVVLPAVLVGIVINYQRWRRAFAAVVPDTKPPDPRVS